MSRSEARSALQRLQTYIGIMLLLSAAAGIYLLATDGSLWVLAVSHAVGLVIIVVIDFLLGVLSLFSVRKVYLASLAGASLGIALQLGDILTAPQYGMSIAYFSSYLLELWAFDLLLALQGAIIVLGVLGRASARFLSTRRTIHGKELGYSRRSFVKAVVGFAAAIGAAVLLGSIKVSVPSSQLPTGSTQPNGPIANVNSMQPGSPIEFEYPAGYPNILLKKGDGTLVAFSLLCTHICCQCTWDPSNSIIYCPCHGSVFDTQGMVLRGPASYPLPSVTLRTENNGDIYPTGRVGSSPCMQA